MTSSSEELKSNQPIKKEKYHHQFRWDSSVPQQVLIKGSFDQWQSTLELIKEPSGKFGQSIELDHGSKVSYKYIIDGIWRHNPNEPTETDSNGNINNVLEVPAYVPSEPPSESQHADEEPQPEPTTSDTQISQEPQITDDKKDLTNTAAFPTQSLSRIPSSSNSPSPPARLPTRSMIGGRTHSLMSQSRSRHTSYHSPSLLGSPIAPGTPTEKSTPAQTSVSTVVSAMAGAAATAIPAAIFAVTGKDIIRNSSRSVSSSKSMPVASKQDNPDGNVSAPNSAPEEPKSGTQTTQPIPLTLNDAQENDEVVKGKPEVDTHLQLDPSPQDASEQTEGGSENKPVSDVQEVPNINIESNPIVGGSLQVIEETASEISQNDQRDTKLKDDVPDKSTSVTDQEPSTESVIKSPTENNAQPASTAELKPVTAPEQVAKLEAQPPATEPALAQPTISAPISTPEPNVKPSPTSQTLSTTPKLSSTPNPENENETTTTSKGKYGNLSPNRSTPQQANKNGGWRVSIGSIGKKSHLSNTEAESLEDPSTPVRKRKTSLFQKIKVAFSPGHKKASGDAE